MKSRILTAAVLLPVVLAAVWITSPWPLFVLALAAAAIAASEFSSLTSCSAPAATFLSCCPLALGMLSLYANSPVEPESAPLALALGAVIGAAFVLARTKRLVSHWSTVFGALWIGCPLAILVLFTTSPFHGGIAFEFKSGLYLFLLPIWAADIAAMLIGKRFGRKKLLENVSPNKTWAGSWAALVAAMTVSIFLALWLELGIGTGIAVGLSCGIMGQAGDLLESALKRSVGAKDSGTILRGHGGLLDRIDAMLLATPFVCVSLVFL